FFVRFRVFRGSVFFPVFVDCPPRLRRNTMFAASPTRGTPARRFGPLLLCAFVVISLAIDARGQETGWVALFNGKDLDGWTPKIKGYAAGENYADTFRVEDGVLKVSYDKYAKFDEKFGHLF